MDSSTNSELKYIRQYIETDSCEMAFKALLSKISTPIKRHPFIFGTLIAGCKSGGVDVGIQHFAEGKSWAEHDWRRSKAFFVFGSLFCGAWQYGLFVKLMPRLCPGALEFAAKPWRQKLADKQGLKNLFYQNFVENGINNPFLHFPVFYTVQEWIAKRPLSGGIEKFKQNFWEDVPRIWAIWVPAQLYNFGFSPAWMRVPFVAFVSAFWTCILSVTRGEIEE